MKYCKAAVVILAFKDIEALNVILHGLERQTHFFLVWFMLLASNLNPFQRYAAKAKIKRKMVLGKCIHDESMVTDLPREDVRSPAGQERGKGSCLSAVLRVWGAA